MNKILFLLTIIFFTSCKKDEKSTFTIQGSIKNPETNYIVLFQESDIERKTTTLIDTITLTENGEFKASFKVQPHYYSLQINANKKIPLAIDKGQIISIEIDNSNTKITGSKDTELLMEYENLRANSLEQLVQSIRKQIVAENESENPNPQKIDSLGKLEIKNYTLHLEELNTFIKEKMGTSIALYPTSLRWKGQENINLFDSLVSNFEMAHPNLSISKKLREKVSRLQQTTVGGKASGIVMETADKTTVSLYSLNKKYTLIDFWASWCGPCRRESEVLNQLYKNYKNNGFEIYGVSLDTNREQWIKAIETDQRSWTNVSSLEGFKTDAAYNYAVTALPMNYLIDSKGKIIAKDLHGEELKKLIDKLFK
ncbi:AhpC/TSA family protein [Aureibaculum marinum]|uniref:AhpC/TSA family protein n=1 Tax=Aureibaculum marinum TaxID=2487930 RepID=A0A3N4NDY2_9FLAO|nr:TlpA disulfide reductase family protein [Aureibaculum marinum]RPD94582.1 AhpC/TSA family protein [Aureibaculum marinum]